MNKTILRADTRFLVFGNNAETKYSDTDLDRDLNRAYQELIAFVLRYCGKWQHRGTYAVENLLAGVNKYDLPGDILRLNRVQVKPISTLTEHYECLQVDPRIISGDLDNYKPSKPEFDIRNNKLVIYWDTAIEAITGGLKIWYQDEITELSAVTDEPDLPEFAHRFISLKAAYDYCIAWEMWHKVNVLKIDFKEIKEEIKSHYSTRDQTGATIMTGQEINLY